MLAEYITKAFGKAAHEMMENCRFFAILPGFKGLWAKAETFEAARRELIFSHGRSAAVGHPLQR